MVYEIHWTDNALNNLEVVREDIVLVIVLTARPLKADC